MNRLLLRNLKPVGLAVQKTCSQRQKFVLRAQLRAFSDNKAPNAAEAKDTHSKPEAGAEADAEKAKEGEAGKNVMKVDFDEYDDYYEPQTPKEKVGSLYSWTACICSLIRLFSVQSLQYNVSSIGPSWFRSFLRLPHRQGTFPWPNES